MEPAEISGRQDNEDGSVDFLFPDNDSAAVIRALYTVFPGEWVALHLSEREPVTGLTPGRVIAHSEWSSMVVYPLVQYQKRITDSELHYFRTDLYEPVLPRGY